MSPKELIKNWVEIFNTADAKKMAEFYHDKAINHQINSDAVVGKEAIFEMFQAEFKLAEIFLKIKTGPFLNGGIHLVCVGVAFFRSKRIRLYFKEGIGTN